MSQEIGMPHILVYAPYPAMRQALALALRQAGWQVAQAQTDREALKALEQTTYNALVLDLDSPPGDSWSILQALQGSHETIPVVALFGPESDRVLEAQALGAHVILPKPVSKQALMTGVNAALQVRSGQSSS
jgi:DNA-binding response OmpR family regulator